MEEKVAAPVVMTTAPASQEIPKNIDTPKIIDALR
jgi:hypothetical protein